jgi:hypothetical protein
MCHTLSVISYLNKNQKNAENLTTVVRTPKKSAGDAASKQLRGASSKLGNSAVEDKLLKKPEQAPAKAPEAAQAAESAPQKTGTDDEWASF